MNTKYNKVTVFSGTDDKLKNAQDTIAKIVDDNGEIVDFDVE